MKYIPQKNDTKMIDHPELDRFEREYRDLRIRRLILFLKYFFRNVFLVAVLIALFYAGLYAYLKSRAGL